MTEGTTRTELARWFIDHDEIEEAARVLAPGDQLELGRSDSLDLTAALARRGLAASYQGRLLRVGESSLGAQPRKPPARSTPAHLRSAQKNTG